jgi:hypothetical protein
MAKEIDAPAMTSVKALNAPGATVDPKTKSRLKKSLRKTKRRRSILRTTLPS